MVVMRFPRAYCGRSAAGGFTLIEAMVTVSLLVVLLAIAAPGMGAFMASQRVRSGSFDVYASLLYARSEAIKRHSDVSLVASTTDWSSGWTVQDGSGNVLRTQDSLKGVIVTSSAAELTYRLDGRLTAGSALVVVESQTGADAAGRRCLTIDTTGLPRSRSLKGSATCT
jgi:type IV fimbrial biogenesis protein FimT